MKYLDPSTIDPKLRACIGDELASLPDARLIERKGRLFLKGRGGFEILLERLCEVKRRWVELVEYAPIADEDKWFIFNLLLLGDGRLEEIPGLGLKVILPARPRH